jgi:hypothetical protein
MPHTAEQIMAASLLIVLFVCGLYDVAVTLSHPPRATVSRILSGWFHDWPILAVMFGILIGHLCWPPSPDAAKQELQRQQVSDSTPPIIPKDK